MPTIPPISCTDTELTVREPLDRLPDDVADAITTWLHAHGLDENDVILGHPIVRDTRAGTVTAQMRPPRDHTGRRLATSAVRRTIWHAQQTGEHGEHGDIIATVVHRLAPDEHPDGNWPAPFPQVLLDQPTPDDLCPTCLRPRNQVDATWTPAEETPRP